jgi:DNA-binding MarR family transcriptional regulator
MDDRTDLSPPRGDYESGVSTADRLELRVWLRLLTCANLIETGVRQKLHQAHAMTLPRFDILAQLHRADGALSMGELSRRLMVSNGNVTGLVEKLVKEGLVDRRASAGDRRVQMVSLTPKGRRSFEDVARAHRDWIAGMMDGLGRDDLAALHALLARLKQSVIDDAAKTEGRR